MNKYCFAVCLFFFTPSSLFAYLDPGTGSLLLSSLIAIAASGIFFIKNIYYRVFPLINGGGVKRPKKDNHSLVFYSEGKQYHNVFKPILEYLDSHSYPYTYLTSSQEDLEPYLANLEQIKAKNPHAEFEYIGASDSNKAIARLNSLRADIVLMSTPQLDVLQIKRSKGVKHYSHIIHSLPHVDIYEVYALDYFDSVLTNSHIHTDFIHEVERVRNLHTKQVIITGCTYLDILQEKLISYQQSAQKVQFFNLECSPKSVSAHIESSTEFSIDSKSSKKYTILLAPSWGREALLSKYGIKLITPFINSDFNLIIRPHPQSYFSESTLLEELKKQTKDCANIAWDSNRDNIYALEAADMMMGDFSGVIFDFICLFEKPVLTPTFHFNIIGYDLEDIYETPWVQNILPQIGKSIEPSEFERLPQVIESLLNDKNAYAQIKQNIKALKAELWEYQNMGGEMSAKALLRIHKEILEARMQEKLELHHKINALDSILAQGELPRIESSTLQAMQSTHPHNTQLRSNTESNLQDSKKPQKGISQEYIQQDGLQDSNMPHSRTIAQDTKDK